MSSIFKPMKIEDMGEGIAERRVRINGTQRVRGDALTHADLVSIAVPNRNAMIENRIITVFPKHVPSRADFGAQPTSAAVEGQFHVIAKGFGKYDVIKGIVQLTGATKDAAVEFVAAQAASAGTGPQSASTSPAGGTSGPEASPGPKGTRKRPKRPSRRRPRSAPPPDAPQQNGPA